MTVWPEKGISPSTKRNWGQSGISYSTARSVAINVLNSDPTPIATSERDKPTMMAVMQVLGVENDLELLARADPMGRELQDARVRRRCTGAPGVG